MFRAFWLMALLTLAALACAAPAPVPARFGAPADTPKYGGTLNVRVPDDPGTGFDLSLFKSQPAWEGQTLAYNSLLGYRIGPDVPWADHVIRGELAERWEVSPDARTFTFYLRKGLKFASLPPVNGRELTSADVKWTYEYWTRTGQFKDKKLQQGLHDWMFEGLDRIDTPDPQTVAVRFSEPYAPFLAYASSDSNPIVPREIYERDGHLKDTIVGTGPFQLDREASQPGSRWAWKKNPDFYEAGKPYMDGINWLVVKDDAAAFAAFKARQLDMLGNSSLELSMGDVEEMKKLVPDAVIHQHSAATPWHLFVNTRVAPLGDVRIRRAMSQAIDRDEFIKVLMGGQGRWGFALLPPDTFTGEEVKQYIKYDPEASKRLVAEAGFPNGLELEATYPGKDYGEEYITGLQLLQAQLKKAGITLNLRSVSKVDYSNGRKVGDYVINMQQGSTLEGDIDSALFANFHSKSRKNYSGTKDAKLDDLLVAQRREADPAKRRALVRDIVKYSHAEMFYDIGMHYGMYAEVWHPYLKNFGVNMGVEGIYPVDSWLEK